jgi:hypothetical protein
MPCRYQIQRLCQYQIPKSLLDVLGGLEKVNDRLNELILIMIIIICTMWWRFLFFFNTYQVVTMTPVTILYIYSAVET